MPWTGSACCGGDDVGGNVEVVFGLRDVLRAVGGRDQDIHGGVFFNGEPDAACLGSRFGRPRHLSALPSNMADTRTLIRSLKDANHRIPAHFKE